MRPVGGALFDGFSIRPLARLVCHCLLLETERDGLVLIDTGFGSDDLRGAATTTLSAFFRYFNNIRMDASRAAVHQIRDLGLDPADVRHIVLTHLDFDHAGGLRDFPAARVHVLGREWDYAHRASGFLGSRRYRAGQWSQTTDWRRYDGPDRRWFDFDAIFDLDGMDAEIGLIPLPGHTPGHAAVAIRTAEGWLLHGGDSYFYRGEMGGPRRRCTPGLRLYQTMMEVDRKARQANQERLRRFSRQHKDDVRIFSSHDARELQELAGQGLQTLRRS